MKLYHFTSSCRLRAIGLYGLTVGDVPTDLASATGQCGVWLTSDGSTPKGHGLEGSAADKLQYRLTVDAPNNELLARWIDWAAENVTPETIDGLHRTAPNFSSWYVYFGVINRSAITDCLDMRTGDSVKNWADRPPSPSDVKPVPPWRRRTWHKKLLKDSAKHLRKISAPHG